MIKLGEHIVLEISKDCLEAYITLAESEENKNIDKDLRIYIDEIKKHIKYGLKENLLQDILKNKKTNNKVLIAEGQKAINGEDGSIKYNFSTKKNLAPKIKPDGTVDYRELNSINNVKKDFVLAEIVPPKEGKVGINIKGEEILFKKGRNPRFNHGKNVKISLDGNQLLSNIDGLVQCNKGKIVVLDLLEVDNVDSSVGNIDFNGSIIIGNDVFNGYSVKATGDVEVRGALEGGYINCDGDVLIRQGIQGYNKLAVEIEGNLATKFIENTIGRVKGNITSEAIMHSNISSDGKILVLGNKGLIVGGTCKSSSEIRAKTVGSTMATTTVLEIGSKTNSEKKLEEINLNLKKLKKKIIKIKSSVKTLEILKKSNKLGKEKMNLFDDLKKAEISLNININNLENEKKELTRYLEKSTKGLIKVSNVIYPGTKIIIGNSFMFIKDEIKNCTLFEEDGEIRIGPY